MMEKTLATIRRGAMLALGTLLATAPAMGQLVVNEIDYDQSGTDSAEFIEIKNISGGAVNLDPFALELVNGNDDAVYLTIDLPNVNLPAGQYYVVCGDAAIVENCDLDTTPEQNLVQNGAPDALAIVQGASIIDAVSYEGDVAPPYIEGSGVGLEDDPNVTNAGISRFPDGVDTNQNNVDLSFRCSTPGETNSADMMNCAVVGGLLEIWEIQGNGLASPFVGQAVATESNLVNGVDDVGFFMQTPTARSDGDDETSDGIWVFTGDPPGVAIGDLVDVTGEIEEFFDLTEINAASGSVTVISSGNLLPPAVVFDANTPSPNQPQPENEVERYEGMLVSAAGVVTEPSNLFGDAQMVAKTDRTFREPGIEFPGMGGLPIWDGNPEIFEIAPNALGLPQVDLVGGQLVMAEGPLGFSFGDYRIAPTSINPGAEPPLPGVRSRAAGEFIAATLSARDLFDDVDDPDTSDPVLTPLEVETKLVKLSLFIRDQLESPDVLALQEVENLTILQALAAQITDDDPGVVYTASLLDGNDFEGSDVGYLTRDDTITVNSVAQFGADIIFSFDGSLLYDRPPLVLEATYTGSGGPFAFTAVNVHQRSLGGIDDPVDGDRVKNKRLEQAVNLSFLLQDEQTGSAPVIALGDFNAYEFTDGYVDVMGQVTGNLDPLGDELDTFDAVNPNYSNATNIAPAEERYTFVFDGNAESLDHVVTSSAMTSLVTGVDYGRGNADAPEADEADPSTFRRASDHDGVAIYVAPQGGGGFSFTISGSCPGSVTLSATGGTPGGVAGIIFGQAGSDPLLGGPCAGTQTDLTNPQLFRTLPFDGSGSFSLTATAPSAVCGLSLQVVDGASCTVSNPDTL